MYGLQKGALGALIDKAGTPFDQVDLMVKLLRQAGYTASYVSGTITLTGAQFTTWTGISDSNGACQMLANGGIPAIVNGATTMTCATGTGSSITSVVMAHIWVQVTIPGSSCSSGCLFDPSYKPYNKMSSSFSLATATGLVSGAPFTAATTGMTSGTLSGSVPYVNGLNSTALNSTIQGYAQNLLNYMYSNNLQAAQMEDIVGGGVIAPDTPPAGGWRQTSLPYSTSATTTWTGNVPDEYRTKLYVSGFMWDYAPVANPQTPCWDNMFQTTYTPGGVIQFFVDQIYGRALTVDTDYGMGMNANGDSQYANTVYLRLDGVTLITYVDPAINTGYIDPYGYYLYETSRGAPAYMTLSVQHPYAASATSTITTASGGYMSATLTRPVVLITSMTIVDGFGDTSGALFTKWADEKAGDTPNPITMYSCPVSGGDLAICGTMHTGGTGDFEREKMSANWLGQYTRAAHLHAAIAGAAYQLHHEIGFAYGDNFLNPVYETTLDQQEENPIYEIGDNFNRLDVDSALSVESRTADPVARRATIQAIAASSAALEGSVSAQMDGLPDTASTATRFEWGNAPPGTAGNWDAPSCGSPNAYEDPGCPGARNFVQYTSATGSLAASLGLVEDHAPSYYTGDGLMERTQQPIIGGIEAGSWSAAYSSEIAAYTGCASTTSCGTQGNVPFTVTTSQEAFLGPGQRGGAIDWQSSTINGETDYTGYFNSPSRQRGPAFVATAYDSNGDPLAIAHDLVGIDGPFGAGGSPNLTKGGGGGNEPTQSMSYSPADAGDILKARFVDKSNAMGVNLSNGSMGYTAPAKLDEGNGGFPYELTAELEWHPAPFPTAVGPTTPIAPRPGWTTNWHNSLVMSGSGQEAMGKSDVRAAVGTIAAFMAAQDIYKSTPSTQRDVAAVLTQSWWARQMSGNVVTVTLGTSARQFVSLPQGVTLPVSGATWIAPGAGGYATLTMTNPRVAYEQICEQTAPNGGPPPAPYAASRGWDYAGVSLNGTSNNPAVSFTVTNAHGDQQNFVSWSNTYGTGYAMECGFAEGLRLSTWTFPQGVTINVAYGNPWDPGLSQEPNSGDGFAQITQVYNTFGTSSTPIRTIDFNSGADAIFSGFTGSDGRSVSLGFGVDVIADTIADPAGATTSYIFNYEQFQSPTQRPIPYETLFQIYTPDNPNAPNTEYDYDSIGNVKDVLDAEALQVGDRGPYEFLIAGGTRGERDDPLFNPITNPADMGYAVTYDTYGHPASYQDEDGNLTLATADGRGRITQYTYPEGDCEAFSFDDHNNMMELSKVDKSSACNVNAGSSHVISVSATWDQGWNKILTLTDALLNTTTFTYNPTGTNGTSEMATAVRPAVTGGSPTYAFTYDAAGRMLTSTDPVTSSTNITTANTYDSSEELASTIVDTSDLNLTTTYGYDSTGNMTSTVDPRENSTSANGGSTSFTYDLDRRKLETDHHNGTLTQSLLASSRTIYDVLGRDIEDDVGTAFSGTTVTTWVMAKKTTYTPTSKVATVEDGDLRVTSTTYDGADRASVVTDPVFRQSQTVYDAASNVLQQIRALGSPLQETYATYTYGGDGEKLSVYDADGATHITNYSYDGFNRLASTKYPDSSTDQISVYDANSNILDRINRAGQTIVATYDVLNRPLTEVIPAYGSTAADTITKTYDLGGRLDEITDTPGDIVALTYDTAGRITETKTTIAGLSGAHATKYTLDDNGNRTKLTWPDAYYVKYTLDRLDRITKVTDPNAVILATYTYDPYSRRTNLAYSNGASIAYTYSPGSDLLTLTNGFVTTTNNAAYTLGYTNAHQLTSEAVSNTSYDYGPPQVAATTAYAAANVLNQYPTVTPAGGSAETLTYDGNGNLTFDGAFTYTYDPENRLMTACNPNCTSPTVSATYAYDPEGRRQTKTVNSTTVTNFLNDGEDEIAEYDSSGDVLRRFVPGPAINEPVAFETCPGSSNPTCTTIVSTTFFHTDHHGSVVAMSESNGNPASGGADGPFTYDSYGQSPSSQSGGVPFRYVGMYFDAETGLYYDRARYYSPAIGRFLQTDSIGYKDDLDLYTYVRNDPTDATDPNGTDVLYSSYGGGAYYYAGAEVYVGKAIDIDELMAGRIDVATYVTAGGGGGIGAGAGGGGGIFFGNLDQYSGGFVNGNASIKEFLGGGVSMGGSCGLSGCPAAYGKELYFGANLGVGTPQFSGSWTNTWFVGRSSENVDLSPFMGTVDKLSSAINRTNTTGSRILTAQKEKAMNALKQAKQALQKAQQQQQQQQNQCSGNPSACPSK